MALHKLQLEDFYDDEFALFAIHCNLEPYRLAFMLNRHLKIRLARTDDDLDYNYLEASFSLFEWDNEQEYTTWNLVSNVCKREVDSLQSSGSLFEGTQKVLKSYYLCPEFKNVDYFLKISSEGMHCNEKVILDRLQTIPQIITSYSVDVSEIKSKDNLIFK